MSDVAPPPPPIPSVDIATPLGEPVAPRYWTPEPQPWPAPRALRGIARAVRWLILTSAVGALLVIGAEVLHLSAISGFLDRSVGIDTVNSLVAVSTAATLVSALLLLAAGICWAIWQYRAASSVPTDALRHFPTWHAGSWFIPVATWWLPVQNVSDLVEASRAAVGRGVIATWWTLWLGATLSYLVVNRVEFQIASLSERSITAIVSITGEVLLIGAAVFAWLIVTRITDALDPARR
ncbi:MAG: DUF4328 domain-containing protein [Microbacterium sp.]|nr:DUF4328 domain-containing protein [Microbacterium sp.]